MKCSCIQSNYDIEFVCLKRFANLLKGKSYDLLGKRDLAIQDYKEVLKMDDYYPEVEDARILLKKPFIVKN